MANDNKYSLDFTGEQINEKLKLVSALETSEASEGQFLRVVNGVATWVTVPNANDIAF